MKRALIFSLCLTALCWGDTVARTKPLEPPPEGKAYVYMGRLTGFVGRARPFHFFHNDTYLARVKGKNYIRIECDPGENLFWVDAGIRSFVKADLEAGRSYALFAKLVAGTWTAGSELLPIVEGSKDWDEFRDMIDDKKAEEPDEKYLAKWNRNKPDYIKKALEEWKQNGEPAITLRSDEFIE